MERKLGGEVSQGKNEKLGKQPFFPRSGKCFHCWAGPTPRMDMKIVQIHQYHLGYILNTFKYKLEAHNARKHQYKFVASDKEVYRGKCPWYAWEPQLLSGSKDWNRGFDPEIGLNFRILLDSLFVQSESVYLKRSILGHHPCYILQIFEYKANRHQARKSWYKLVTSDKGPIAKNVQNTLTNLNFCWDEVGKKYPASKLRNFGRLQSLPTQVSMLL